MVAELVIDQMKKWHFIVVTIFLLLLVISTIVGSIFSNKVQVNEMSPYIVTVDEEGWLLTRRFNVEKHNKYLELYLQFEPGENSTLYDKVTTLSFDVKTQLHMIQGNIDYYVIADGSYSTTCHFGKCEDVLLISDDAVREATYILIVSIEDNEGEPTLNDEGMIISFIAKEANPKEIVVGLSFNALFNVVSLISLFTYIVVVCNKREFTIFTTFNILLLIGLTIMTDPFRLMSFHKNYVLIEYLDSFLMELYCFILFVWLFFHMDHLQSLAIGEHYPIGQWILRSILLIFYFTCTLFHFFLNVIDRNSHINKTNTPLVNDTQAISQLLQFFIIFWIFMQLAYSFTKVMHPTNRKRLMLLIPCTVILLGSLLIQIFFTGTSQKSAPIPNIFLKGLNLFVIILMSVAFHQLGDVKRDVNDQMVTETDNHDSYFESNNYSFDHLDSMDFSTQV